MDTSTNNADSLISSFPSFDIGKNLNENWNMNSTIGNAYMQWVSWFYGKPKSNVNPNVNPNVNTNIHLNEKRELLEAPGFTNPLFGVWDKNTVIVDGIGGSGVMCVFNMNSNTNVVLSPLDNFMTVSQYSSNPGKIEFGIMGNVTEIPKDFSMKTIMFISDDGINNSMKNWGTLLRNYYQKGNSINSRSKDVTLQYLGFNTDNGAYYYYNTVPGLNYEETMISVKKYADEVGLPYRYVLLDSWWYFKGEDGGVTNWTARPDIFPNGIEAVYKSTGWLVQAHNRWWSPYNTYATQNGGQYLFDIDNIKNGSVPLEQKFWDDLLSIPTSNWGLRVYEQDWLYNEFYVYVSDLLKSVSLGRTWLLQMGLAAEKNGLTIQYCMPYIRHVLQSLEISAVTQARASDDYKPLVETEQWRIGGQSILFDALGLSPSKDGIWTTTFQDGSPYGEEGQEYHSRLQAAVLSLSTGPIAIGDGIGYSNVDLILKSCMKVSIYINIFIL